MDSTRRVVINGRECLLTAPASNAYDAILRAIYVQQEYPYLSFIPTQGAAILDIGANVGFATVLFASLYPAAKIYAFEPGREPFHYLRQNVQSFPNVKIFNHGLFDRDGKSRLYHGQMGSFTNSIGRSALNTEDFEEIRLRRCSSVMAELGISNVALLKMDTEGAEVPILRDIEDLLGTVRAVCLEYHSERDRIEIDGLLQDQFLLYQGHAGCHRGTMTYVAKALIAAHPELNQLEIPRPRIE